MLTWRRRAGSSAPMPRTLRASVGGLCYHVLNRGNGRATVFRKDGDYAAFVALLAEARRRRPMRLLSYCLMPNHFHLGLWPQVDGDLSAFMQWLMNAHVRRYHQHYHSLGGGHVWQGRFKAFPIQADEHLLAVYRYVERNPLRAGLVQAAQDWPWSSLAGATGPAWPEMLDRGPVARTRNWLVRVNQAESQAELAALRRSVRRGVPHGAADWVQATAARLGLGHTLRPRGRPPKTAQEPK
jgi:putative transposase